MMTLLIFTSLWAAQEIPGEELWVAPAQPAVTVPVEAKQTIEETKAEPEKPYVTPSKRPKRNVPRTEIETGNLPSEYRAPLSRASNVSELIQPPKGAFDILKALRAGDILEAQVLHSIIAFPDEKAPVVATIDSGALKGTRLLGESQLERNSRRIFVKFTKLVLNQKTYQLKADGVSQEGQPGLLGEYYSREAEYFAGDFIASFVAGYFDGLVPRQVNPFGQVQFDPSVDTALKRGVASGALSTAERFREKLKRVPEFSEMKGPLSIRVLILEQPKSEQ